MHKRWAIAAVLAWGSAGAADLVDDPKTYCSHFERLGMKAQFHWGPLPQGGMYFCQYSEEFGSRNRYVRGGRAYIDPEKKVVGLSLAVQSFGLVKAEALDVLLDFVEHTYAARQLPVPPGLVRLVSGDGGASLQASGLTITPYEAGLWDAKRTVGVSWERPAPAALLASLASTITADEKAALAGRRGRVEARCDAAVLASGHGGDPARLRRKVTQLSAGRFMVELGSDAGTYICTGCDEMDPKLQCGSMGVRLSFQGSDGQRVELPAELRRKCEYSLQHAVKSPTSRTFIDQELVRRIRTREVPNDKRYVFEHQLDGVDYRCVVRKSDLNYTLDERRADGSWRGISTGSLP